MSKTEASSKILNFLNKENRPFSISDVFEKCGKEFGRSTVQKSLDALADKNKIVAKTFGKQTIYHAKQSNDLAEIRKQLQICHQKLAQSLNNVKSKQTQLRELEMKLKTLSNIRSVEELEKEREQIVKEICEMNEKLKRYEANSALAKFTPAVAQKIEKRYENLATAYRKRKRICNDMVDAILEGYPKSKKILIEDIGLETDEAVGFKVEVKR